MTVKRRRDTQVPRVIQHRVADIRGGVSVNVSELGGDYLAEGAVLSEPINGVCYVVKVATLTAEATATATELKVAKRHNFKVGDYVMAAVKAKAYAITKIDATHADYDVLTIGTTLGVKLLVGDQIAEAAAESTESTSALKYAPLAIAGTGKPIEPNSNLNTDAWVMAVTKGLKLPDFVAEHLRGVINY